MENWFDAETNSVAWALQSASKSLVGFETSAARDSGGYHCSEQSRTVCVIRANCFYDDALP